MSYLVRRLIPVLLCLWPLFAHGQSVPGPTINPNANCTQTGPNACTIWTPAQWIAAWEAKTDVVNGTLTSPTVTGGTFSSPTLTTPTINSIAPSINVIQKGADPTGVANSTAAFNAATAAVSALGGGIVVVPLGKYLIDPISIPANVTLAGSIPGPFEAMANPAITVIAPTLIPNSTGASLIQLTGMGASIQDILIYYPQQVAPSASTPNTYPATILASGAANNIRRMTLVNSYIGIAVSNGRDIVEGNKIGAYSMGIIVDPAEDWVILANNMIQVFYDTFLNLSYPQTIDTWVMNHGTGIQVGRADSIQGINNNVFAKFACVVLTDGTHGGISPQYGWGRFTNTDCDTVAFGIDAISTNSFAQGYQFVNTHVTANSGVGTTGQQWLVLSTGGTGTPVVGMTGGGVIGTWSGGSPPGYLNSAGGVAYITNLQGVTPVEDIGPPSFPLTTANLVNPYPVPVTIYISGGTVSTVAINGTNTLSTTGPFRLGVNQSIAIGYTGSPSWVWFGD